MLGAIAGDMIGSVYEHNPIKTTEFTLLQENSHFTDDSVMTLAIAHAILKGRDYRAAYQSFGRLYPHSGYGSAFIKWIFMENAQPYNSYGNGSAMRVSPVGIAFNTVDEVLEQARFSGQVSHNHPEGTKGAQATALAVYFARSGGTKETIRHEISYRFGYDLDLSAAEIRPSYHFDVTCQGTVPQALIAFFESDDYEHAVRLAISLGGDSDTLGCITGGIAQAFYKEIPSTIEHQVRARLPDELLEILDSFMSEYPL